MASHGSSAGVLDRGMRALGFPGELFSSNTCRLLDKNSSRPVFMRADPAIRPRSCFHPRGFPTRTGSISTS